MAALQPVRGTQDILIGEMRRQRGVIEAARDMAWRYGFDEVATPVFEFSDVFRRTLGEASDIVQKEMYTFTDRSGDELTLRPEGTAGIARAYIAGGWQQHAPVKVFYTGPMFRHERPQKGRMRQFHQVGVELMGSASPWADVETIAMGADFLASLGLSQYTTLELNTIGDPASRARYRDALVAYFSAYKDRLSADSRDRLARNPLRILDSKDPSDREIVAGAPTFDSYLSAEASDFFAAVTEGLGKLGIAYRRNPYLVRGLDYYTHTAFEFTTETLGAQGTVLAGGRYDGLIAQMGGPDTPAIGWAAGIERLAMLAHLGAADEPERPIVVVPQSSRQEGDAFALARDLRGYGLRVEVGFSGNMKKRLQRANRANASYAVLIGSEELGRGEATVRGLDSGEQVAVALERLGPWLAERPGGAAGQAA